MPRKLRESLEGKQKLTTAQETRALAKTAGNLGRFKLEILNNLALEMMSTAIGRRKNDVLALHAIQLATMAEENSRGLKRMLRRLFAGEPDYVIAHPVTRHWLSHLKKVNSRLWLAGISRARHVEGIGEVEISVEGDPLEVLKMGSYFNTCLGLGGICAYSAAAVALDINKRVLYVKNADGHPLARMLVAIDTEERLVCFSVYPESAPAELKKFFRNTAADWAGLLGTRIYSSAPDAPSYNIQNILASGWWDDHPWDKPSKEKPGKPRR